MGKIIYMYGLPHCSTCKEACRILQQRGYEVQIVNVKTNPLAKTELINLIALSQLPIKKWFNISGISYRQGQLKDKLPIMNEEEKIALLSSDGMLLKRPIIVDGDQVTVGFKHLKEVYGLTPTIK